MYKCSLKYYCKDDGFVVASLRGLLDERNQYKQKIVKKTKYIYIVIYLVYFPKVSSEIRAVVGSA